MAAWQAAGWVCRGLQQHQKETPCFLHTVMGHGGETLQVAAGAHPGRPAVVITLLGRDCFEGRVMKWSEDSKMLRLLLHLWFLVFITVHQTVEHCALCYTICLNGT